MKSEYQLQLQLVQVKSEGNKLQDKDGRSSEGDQGE